MSEHTTTASAPCVHSSVEPDCVSCWQGVVHRQHAHIQRLRAMIVELDGEADLASHDLYWFGGRPDPLPPPTDNVSRLRHLSSRDRNQERHP